MEEQQRIFNFHDNQEGSFQVVTFFVGKLEEVFQKLNENNNQKEQIKLPQNLLKILAAFREHKTSITKKNGEEIKKNPHLLISGGFVRDILIGESPNDIDLTTNMELQEIYDLIKDLDELKRIDIQGESSPVVRVKFNNGEEYEISSFKKAEDEKNGIPGKDAMKRDFTINGLFYNPLSGKVFDYVGGIKDIQEKRLRFSGDPEERIKEDPLRMLRFVRFIFKTGFISGERDKVAIKKMAELLKKEPVERVKIELDKIFQLAKTDQALELLDELGLLETIFPEIKQLKDCKQGPPYHMEGDVWKHTLMVAENLPETANLRLKWATVFHDIGKPETREEKELFGEKKVSFLKHDEIGASKAKVILGRLRFSNKELEEIIWLIKNHQVLFQRVVGRIKNAEEKNLAKSKIKAKAVFQEMIREKGLELVSDLVSLALADSKGNISLNKTVYDDGLIIQEIFEAVLAELEQNKRNGIDWKKIVSGKIIMETLGMEPGPEIGIIQKKVLQRVFELGGEFKDEKLAREKAVELILRLGSTRKAKN